MLKKIILLLVALSSVAFADRVTKTYTFDTPVIKNGYTYVKGCRPSLQGFAPAVSVLTSRLLLPVGTQAKSVTVTYGDLVEVAGDHFIKPTVPAYGSKGSSLSLENETIYQDATARKLLAQYYEKDALFPGTIQSPSVHTGLKNGHPIAMTLVNPVQYNPVRRKIYYYKTLTLSVETEQLDPARKAAARVLTPFTRSLLQFTVDNPEALADQKLTPKDKDDYDVLLITHSTVQNSWNDYIAFNKRRGFKTKLVNVSDALAVNGKNNADKIRNFIKEEYNKHKVVFVVLGGDVNHIAHREFYCEAYDHNHTPDRFQRKYSGSDLYFGTLDGTWNNNNNGKYGEPGEEDIFWEVYVSRIPVDNTSHLSNISAKTLHYSETPKRDQVNNLLMAGQFLWDDYGVTVWGADNLEQFRNYKDEFGWKTYGFPTPKFKVTWLTDKSTGAAHGWDGSDLRAKILSSKPTFIHHDGHGNTTFCYAMGSRDISRNFPNKGEDQNYFVSLSGACNPGQFKVSDCFMETLLNLKTGAVGLISNWDSGFADDNGTNAPGGVPYRFFGDAIFNPKKRVHFLEAMHALSKEALADAIVDPDAINKEPYYGLLRYSSYNTNLLGDPALSLWTDTPKDITKNTFSISADKTKFSMKTPPYTSVALANPANDEIITTQLTGYKYNANVSFVVGDSTCEISDDLYKAFAVNNSKVKVFVKAHNYIAGSFEVDIVSTANKDKTPLDMISALSIHNLNGSSSVSFMLKRKNRVALSLYTAKGVLVSTVIDKELQSGKEHVINLNTNTLSCGLYYCKIAIDNTQMIKPIVVAK